MSPTSKLAVRVCHENPLLRAGLAFLIDQAVDLDVRVGAHGAADEAVDVIVTDYANALELAVAGSAAPGYPAIVVLTHRDTEVEVARAIRCGVHGYVLQDASPRELIDSIRYVGRRRSRYLCKRATPLLEGGLRGAGLTAREEEVLGLIVNGDGNKGIAKQLDISMHTVKAHVLKICGKLHVHSRAQAAAAATRRGLVRL